MRPQQVKAPSLSCHEAKQLIASRIKQARLNCGFSQEEVAKSLFCDQATVSRIERGLLSPDAAQIRTLSGLFQLSVLWLLGYPSFVVHATQNDDDA